MDSRSRTVDQMVQAARSGRQNIAEESRATATSSQTELCLLDRQIIALEKAFVEGGGYSEQLAAARLVERKRHKCDLPNQADPTAHIPPCPQCGKPMVVRTAQAGKNAGRQLWGCSAYPDCRGVVNV